MKKYFIGREKKAKSSRNFFKRILWSLLTATLIALGFSTHGNAAIRGTPTDFIIDIGPAAGRVFEDQYKACEVYVEFIKTSYAWNPNIVVTTDVVRVVYDPLVPTYQCTAIINYPAPRVAESLTRNTTSTRYKCPLGSSGDGGTLCTCNFGFFETPGSCEATAPEPEPLPPAEIADDGLCIGNPISPSTGEKIQFEIDFPDAKFSVFSFSREFRSNLALDPNRVAGPLGKSWNHNFSERLVPIPSSNPQNAKVTTSDGLVRSFNIDSNTNQWVATEGKDTLTRSGGYWSLSRTDRSILTFDPSGKIITRQFSNGWTISYFYNLSGRLGAVSAPFGRTYSFAYDAFGRMISVMAQDGRVLTYDYDALGRLFRVTYSDGKSRGFVYENVAFPQALTGLTDENGARYASFAYDSLGRGINSQHAGSANQFQISYSSPAGSATVVDPLGTARTYSYGFNSNKVAVTRSSLPSGGDNPDAASRVQDANGLVTSETDFKGVKTTTTWDTVRRLPLIVVRAAGTPEAQTTTTQWHPTFSLPVLVSESGRSIAYTYDTAGRLLSEAVTDTLVSPATTKIRSWTWNAQGLVATATEPNGAVTGYTYDLSGNALTVTRPLGHITSYTYDSANRVITQTAPNGLVTAYTWDLRDRLLTQTVGAGTTGAQTTTLTYHPTGTLATLTLPTGLAIAYSYDAAHRLTGWTNTRSESGTFTLDAMGNRVGEQIKNSAGTVAWAASRSVNAINRVASATQGANQSASFIYDANGERIRTTNGLNQSTQLGLDALRRVTSITDPANANATLAYNALDDVTSAKDFKGAATSYGRDAVGNATVETSADTGQRVGVYLPTSAGPMPIATVINGTHYAVSIDHLNTPRRLTSSAGQVMWQWAYSALGETQPTTAAKRFTGPETIPTTGTTTATPVVFNLRFPGQYADSESGLFYNANGS